MDIVDFVRQHARLTREQLVDYIDGTLDPLLKEAVDRHLDVCQFCRNDVDIWTHLLNLPFEDEEVDDDDYGAEWGLVNPSS